MLGLLANSGLIVLGTILGLCFKKILDKRVTDAIVVALGFCVLVIGIKMALEYRDVLVLILSVSAGGLIGTWIGLEKNILRFATFLQNRFVSGNGSSFAAGFSAASILFCTGPMSVVGGINSGLVANHEVLFAKALIDGIISITFAAVYGWGVALSAITVFLYEGIFVLFAGQMEMLAKPHIISEITGVGGVLLCMIGVSLANIKKIPTGDFLPAIPFVIIVKVLMEIFKIL